jgi:UDP-glucuronate 4-epimerase
MPTMLLTGAAGFIGAETARQLLEAGYAVIGVDNLNDYYDPALKRHRLEELSSNERFRFIEADIEDRKTVDDLFANRHFDAVLNLAARAGVRASIEDPFIYMTTNANATLNLLEAMKANSIGKLVQASTSSLYAGQPMPFVETLPVNTPISPYAASKKAAEVMAYTYHKLYGIDVSIVRYFTVFGPAGRPDMMPFRFINWILNGDEIQLFGDGSASRDFTYVEDIAKGTVAALKPLGYEILNLGGGKEPISVNQAISMIEELTGKTARIKQLPAQSADMESTWADISKAEALLDWRPDIGFEEGLRRTIAWHRGNNSFIRTLKR